MADRESKVTEKRQLDLSFSDMFPPECMAAIMEVFDEGAKKYSRDNWRTAPYFKRDNIVKSLFRHQQAIADGQLYDSESGKLHSAHIAVNAIFQLYYDLKGLFNTEGILGVVDTGSVSPLSGSLSKSTIKEGDRVELAEDYGPTLKGQRGTVICVRSQRQYGKPLLDVELDNGQHLSCMYAHRFSVVRQ